MKLKLTLLILLFIISNLKIYAQQFPVNFNTDSLNIAKNNFEKWNGKLISVQCKISQIEKGLKNKPYYKCNLDNESFIWVGSLMDDKKKIKIDETLRILGFLSNIEKNDKNALKYNVENFHLLAFGILNITNKKAYILPGTESQFNDWKNGIIEQEK